MVLPLARLTVRAYTRNGRPYVRLPSGAEVRVSLRQLAAMVREAAFIREHDEG